MQPYPELAPFSRFIRLDHSGLNLHVFEGGPSAAPVIVMLHGLGDEGDTWRGVFSPLAEQYHVLALDLPGFGRSDKPHCSYTIPFFVSTIVEFLDQMGLDQVVLVGHSMGAMIAHAVGLVIPQRLARLVLIAGSLVVNSQPVNLNTVLFMLPGVGEWVYNRLRKDPAAAYATLRPYYADLESLPEVEREFLYKRVNERVWSDDQRRAFLSAIRNMAWWVSRQQRDLPRRMVDFSLPTTLIWGEQDAINPVENAIAFAGLMPSARLVIIPGAGHNVHQERPTVVLAAILSIH